MRHWLRARMARWIRKRQGADSLPLTLTRRRVYIVPTRAGLGFAALLVLMLIAGLNYANSIALFLTFLLCGFMLVTMHQCHRNLLAARLTAASAQPTFAQRHGTVTLSFDNLASSALYQVAAGVGDEPTACTDLPPLGPARVELTVFAARRGLQLLDRIHLITTHPFGLFRTWAWVHAPVEMLVYPLPEGQRPMPGHPGLRTGERPRTSAGSDEWSGLRPFRDGDSPRQVDWKAYAREAPLLVKEYSAAGSELRLFDFGSLGNLPLEARLQQLARWIVDAEKAGERYALSLPGQYLKPDRGAEHRHQCLAALALFDATVTATQHG